MTTSVTELNRMKTELFDRQPSYEARRQCLKTIRNYNSMMKNNTFEHQYHATELMEAIEILRNSNPTRDELSLSIKTLILLGNYMMIGTDE